jgi:hypothetical protein
MRRGLFIFLLVNLIILSLLIRSVSTLLSLLVEDAAADAIHRAELPSPNSSLIEQRPQIIPKIIHQTYKNETIPEVWVEAQQSCIDLHPDYEYIVRPWSPRDLSNSRSLTRIVSSGQTRNRVNLSPPNTLGSWTHSMATVILSSARILFDTLSLRTSVEHTLTSTT